MSPRLAAAITLVVSGAAFVAVIAVTTPWSPLPGPVPGGPTKPDPTGDFTAAEMARDHAFHSAVHPPAYLSLAIGIVVAAVLGFSPLGARLIDAVARPLGGGWAWRTLVGAILLPIIARVVTLPFDVWSQHELRRFGLSVQGWGGWAMDQLRGLAVTLAVLVPVALIAYAVLRALPRWGWAPLAAGAAALVVLLSFAYPIVVEPLFNKFTPLAAGPLRTSLLKLAAEDHVRISDVLIADASRRTTAENAYVSGFGATKRMVLYDNLLKEPAARVRLVVAHELGHAKRNDVLHGTAEGAIGAVAAVAALYLLLTWPWLLSRAGVARLTDPRSLALVLGVITVMTFVFSPLQYLVSRRIEARADVHSLDLTRDPTTFAYAQRQLAITNISSLRPGQLVYVLFYDHPATTERIAMARDWAKQHGVTPPGPLVSSP